jgi:Bacterial Ig domain/PKD domain
MRTTKLALVAAILAAPLPLTAADSIVLGWNNLGMHCMDSDYSVFSILPPYNTIEAQLIVGGQLVTSSNGYTLTYQALADPDGSFNSTAIGKGNFYTFAEAIYGAALAPDMGLAGWGMPGTNNVAQGMDFEATNYPAADASALVNWWRAEGIPLSPYDDAHRKNPYPLMRIIARNASNQPIATNDVVLPVSDEMDCRACHASGTQASAQPSAGWVWSDNPERDYRLNILRKHDEALFQQMAGAYSTMLATNGLNPQGLYRTVVADDQPILCAKCHLSEALPGTGVAGVLPLTAAIHSFHAQVMDPDLHITLDNSANRAACYRCHPGSTTKCLRGAMGGAIAADGSMEMQCQSCHGNMSMVGSTNRVGWFMEPNCQACHTGTAVQNNGQIRYTSAFIDTSGTPRVPVNKTFATQPDTPAPGISLFRFSAGHGGLQCEACHGSTHAEFPSTHRNDNLRDIRLQGHAGMMVECTACHVSMASTTNTMSAGPHGMHPVSQDWVTTHHDLVHENSTQCKVCHGDDYRGTVLSRAQADRTWNVFGTTITFFRGGQIGCYNCHLGPDEGDRNPSTPPSVANASTNTTNDKAVDITLSASGANLAWRIISPATNGAAGLSGNGVATYFPNPGFVGTDTFTYAVYDGSKNSNLGTGTVTVAQGPFAITANALVPPDYPAGWAVPFTVVATPVNVSASPTFDWNFGDAGAHSTNPYATHAYTAPGSYNWSVVSKAQSGLTQVATTNSGTIVIGSAVALSAVPSGGGVSLAWPMTAADALLEQSPFLGAGAHWTICTNAVLSGSGAFSVLVPDAGSAGFYRLRKL